MTPFIPNQPVSFKTEPDNCQDCRDKEFCQLAIPADFISFQFKNFAQDVAPELVENGTFDTDLSGWTQSGGTTEWEWVGGKACIVRDETSSLNTIHQTLDTDCNHFVTTISVSGLADGANIVFSFGGGDCSNQITEDGDYTFICNITGAGGYDVNIQVNNSVESEDTICIDNISVKCIDSWAFCVEVQPTVFIGFDDAYYTYTDGYVTVKAPWTAIIGTSDAFVGCHSICVCNADDLEVNMFIDNGTFDADLSYWGNVEKGGISPSWVWGSDMAGVRLYSGQVSDKLTQYLNLKAGVEYTLQYDTDAGNTAGDRILYVYYNNVLIDTLASPVNGTYSTQFTPADDVVSISFQYEAGTNLDPITVSVDNVKLWGNVCSECFDIRFTKPCSLLLQWTNSTDAYGFDYSGGFTQYMRVLGAVQRGKYPSKDDDFDNSAGEYQLLYSEQKKIQELAIEPIAEYLHDALAIGLKHRDFRVNSAQYASNEPNYQPNWRKKTALAPVIVEVKKTVQNLKNSNC